MDLEFGDCFRKKKLCFVTDTMYIISYCIGNNPTKVCELCRGSGEQKCTSSDPHANFDGALRCLDSDGDVAFVRHDTVATNRPLDTDVSTIVKPAFAAMHGLHSLVRIGPGCADRA